jgi:hypothetical protein
VNGTRTHTRRSHLITSLVLALSLLTASAAWSALRTFLEPRLIDEMDTVRLTIRADGTAQSEAPDLTPLMDDFEVLGNQTSSRISSVNGRTIASVEYQISLRPRRTGELLVPSLKIGDEFSEEIRLAVRPLDPALKETIENMVFFEAELSRNPVYVQAQTILTRRLFYSQGVQIYSDLPGVPEVDSAVVIPLGETQSRSVIRGGQRYGVIEQKFALFPEQSGRLIIPSISVTSSVRLQTAGRTRRSGIRVSTEAIELEVLPIPVDYPADAAWLPATDVSASQAWAPPTGSVDVGAPLTFDVRIRAEGNRGSAIPPVPLPLPADRFKIYPEAPLMDESSDTSTIVGHRSETYALIPTAPGDVRVPPINVTWWDTEADRLRRTEIMVDPIEIIGDATPEVPTSVPEAVMADPEPARDWTETSSTTPRILLITIGSFLAIGLLVLLVRLAARSSGLMGRIKLNVASRRDHHPGFKDLRSTARNGEPTRFRHTLLDYLAAHERTSPRVALDRFREYPGAAEAIRDLDKTIYAGKASPDIDLPSLATLAKAFTETRRKSERSSDPLPALYG